MVEKIIHTIWIGDKKRPDKWIKTWGEKNRSFRHFIWGEKELRRVIKKNKKLYDYFYNKGLWYGASDVARLEILDRFGGVYVDADTECLEPIDELLDCDFFAVEANRPNPDSEYRVANGVIGAKKNHPIIQEYIKRMKAAKVVEPVWRTIGSVMFTKVINELKTEKDIILPPHTFYPESMRGEIKYQGKGKVYARHYWGSTHRLYDK